METDTVVSAREQHGLSDTTLSLAARYLAGELGAMMRPAEATLMQAGDLGGLSENMRYARVAMLLAETAPLSVLDGELVVGSATVLEAALHKTPVLDSVSTSHVTLGFDRVLRLGYRGLRAQVQRRLFRGDLDEDGQDLLRAMLLCLDAADMWHRRHIDLLERRCAQTTGHVRETYERTLAALRHVPANSPRSFHEAVQSLWFQFAFQRLLGNWSGVGRIDEMLWPYLRDDLEAGTLTLDEAREILAHFWIHGCEWRGAATSHIGTSGDGQFYQNIVLAGVDTDGNDITNPVTYLVLDIIETLGISDWPVAVRLSERSPAKLLRRMAEVQRLGSGTVALYNEDVVIDAMTRFGYSLTDARRFANDGCWEVQVPGETCFSYYPIDVLQILQDTLGVTRPDDDAAGFATFEGLYDAYRDALAAYVADWHRRADDFASGGRAAPLVSLFIEDCVERARGYHDRGARYSVFAPHAGGMPDAANCLLAIKRYVYEEALVSLSELVAILRDDWAGHEALRRRFRGGLVAYGNDASEADAMVARLYNDFVTLVEAVHERNGVLRPAGLSTFARQIEWAERRGATAAGTHRGEFLANNFSPSPGTDRLGPTAVIKSFCAVDYRRLPNGTALELKVHPSSVKGEDGIDSLVGLMQAFLRLGGVFMHIDVVDSELLREAQRHPDLYPNLSVRVSGWSARFATLSRDWQDMIIRRTEQEFH